MNHKHKFIPSQKYPDYEFCVECDSYHSINALDPTWLYENDYWSHENGHSTLEEQIYNVTEDSTIGISKVDKIMQYVPPTGCILEIGCAPGSLLKRLNNENYIAIGVEPNENYIPFIEQHSGIKNIIKGYFPKCCLMYPDETFDCIVASEVLEHVENYEQFIKAIYVLLKKGGRAILMLPILYDDGYFRERDFKADEHVWIFSRKFLREYLEPMFSKVYFGRWQIGHEVVLVVK